MFSERGGDDDRSQYISRALLKKKRCHPSLLGDSIAMTIGAGEMPRINTTRIIASALLLREHRAFAFNTGPRQCQRFVPSELE